MLDASRESRLPGEARMLWHWSLPLPDETGRLPADRDDLAAWAFPDRRSVASLMGSRLEELEEPGCIEREETGGERDWRIVRWRRWQRRLRVHPNARPAS